MIRKLIKVTGIAQALALCLSAPAQNFWQNNHPTLPGLGEVWQTSSAALTSVNSMNGHIWSSFQAQNLSGNYSFQIHVTNRFELYQNYPNAIIAFFNQYNFYRTFPNNCNGTLNQMTDCFGTTVIEAGPPTSSAPDTHYAVVASFADADGYGCMFSELNVDGFPVGNAIFFPFPQGSSNPSKPYVVNLPNTRIYFICGAYDDVNGIRVMYAMRLNAATGALPWTQIYDVGLVLEPRGMLISPYNPAELVIVGRNDPPPSFNRRKDGFFMKLDATPAGGGAVLAFETIGDVNPNHNSEFMSVAPAFDNTIADGYVIGGLSDPLGGIGPSWMLRVDQNGLIGGNWNTLITGSNANQEITGVLERNSPMYGFEYYGVTPAPTAGRYTVYRLNNTGGPFNLGNNEYEYLGGGAPGPGFIMDINNGAVGFQGIQVAGTGPGPNYDIYTVKSWFSGESECNTPGESLNALPAANFGPGPNSTIVQTVNQVAGLKYVTCVYLDVNFSPGDDSIVTFCNSSGPSGNNNRMATSGISKDAEQETAYAFFPNPASSQLTASYYLAGNMQVSMHLYNSLGQHIARLVDEKQEAGAHELNIDLAKLNIENGIYFIKTKTGDTEQMQKIVIAK